jgi:hypothetical protein
MKLDSSQRPRHGPVDLVGQTVAINLALVPILLEATGVPFHLTIGWIEQQGKPVLEHLAFGVLHCMGLPNVKPVEDVLGILMQEGG